MTLISPELKTQGFYASSYKDSLCFQRQGIKKINRYLKKNS
ncbi:Uncharacterized protein conserved in archaea (DUF531) [Methanosarcina sp. WWM596]|nr:Uncharacterized protein conserved in archaea (DUF531) [Methanosarcina sp. WWM596]